MNQGSRQVVIVGDHTGDTLPRDRACWPPVDTSQNMFRPRPTPMTRGKIDRLSAGDPSRPVHNILSVRFHLKQSLKRLESGEREGRLSAEAV